MNGGVASKPRRGQRPASKLPPGIWEHWNTGESAPYGAELTYGVAASWLEPCSSVLDLGCGRAYFERFLRPGQSYVGVDGSSPHAAIRCDLEDVAVKADGVLLRHVLEHNLRWKPILRNALRLFTQRMVLVLFVPPETVARIVQTQIVGGVRVPDIALPIPELDELLAPTLVSRAVYDTASQYGQEFVYLLEH